MNTPSQLPALSNDSKAKTRYALFHRLTQARLEPISHTFGSMTEGVIYALLHSLHVDVKPVEQDLFGVYTTAE